MYNQTNQTGTNPWADSDWKKLTVFREQAVLTSKILLIIFATCTILGNTLVLVATWRESSLHQPNKYFVACLAVADLLVGMILEPLLMVYQHSPDVESRLTISIHQCRFAVWIDTFAFAASIYTLTFISFDRYLKVRKPLQYRSRMTTSKSLKIIFIIWLISTAFATYAATPHSGSRGILYTSVKYCSPTDGNKIKVFNTFVAVGAFFLPNVVILVMYALIFVVVHKRQKMLRNGELGQTCNDGNQRSAFLQDLKTIRMLLVVVGVFILCWGPHFICLMLVLYYPNFVDSDNRSLSYWYLFYTGRTVVFTLPLFNSLCNPIIYACLDKTYREAFKNLFQQMKCRPSSRRRQPPEAMELRPLRT
jgi:hypothetical protein